MSESRQPWGEVDGTLIRAPESARDIQISSCEADCIASALRHLRWSFEAHGLRVTEVRLEEVPRGD